jgi:hypothetical protein
MGPRVTPRNHFSAFGSSGARNVPEISGALERPDGDSDHEEAVAV